MSAHDRTVTELDHITLVYRDQQGSHHTQPLADITDAGVLIDSETGDDLVLVHAVVDPELTGAGSGDGHDWTNTIPRELAGTLEDREDDASVAAAEWLREHENDDEVWLLIGRLLDRLTEMATEVPAG